VNIYLDHNASTIVDQEVLSSVLPLMSKPLNPSSIHKDGRLAKSLVENSRKVIMDYFGITPFSHDIIFTSCGTESNNLVLHSLKNHHLFVCATEHASVLNCQDLFEKSTIVPVNKDGLIDLDQLEQLLRDSNNTKKLVSVAHANNETGVIQNIRQISDIVHEQGAILHSDMIQSFGKISFDFANLGIDIATISSHKIGGLHGASAVIKKSDVQISSLLYGGGQERGFRAGTENSCAIAGFAEAVKRVKSRLAKFENIEKIRNDMEDQLLRAAPEAKIYSKDCLRLPNTSCIAMPRVEHQKQVMLFDMKGFSVSAGSACSSGAVKDSHVLAAMDPKDVLAGNAIRISLGVETQKADVDAFIKAWLEVYKQFFPDYILADSIEVMYG
jgi:cysteine desulfurase